MFHECYLTCELVCLFSTFLISSLSSKVVREITGGIYIHDNIYRWNSMKKYAIKYIKVGRRLCYARCFIIFIAKGRKVKCNENESIQHADANLQYKVYLNYTNQTPYLSCHLHFFHKKKVFISPTNYNNVHINVYIYI